MDKGKQDRANRANELLLRIGSVGRNFFSYPQHYGVGKFIVDYRGRIWFFDGYTGKQIYLHYKYWGRGFSEGGTLRYLINDLMIYIRDGTRLPSSHLGPWPDWICGGDLWGYGDDMASVRERAKYLKITDEQEEQ